MYLFNKETGNYHRPFYLIDEATTVDQFHGGNASLAYRVTDEWAYFLGKNAVSHSFRTGKFSFLKIVREEAGRRSDENGLCRR